MTKVINFPDPPSCPPSWDEPEPSLVFCANIQCKYESRAYDFDRIKTMCPDCGEESLWVNWEGVKEFKDAVKLEDVI